MTNKLGERLPLKLEGGCKLPIHGLSSKAGFDLFGPGNWGDGRWAHGLGIRLTTIGWFVFAISNVCIPNYAAPVSNLI